VLARSRQQNKEEAVEGRLWPLVVTLALSAVVGISLGWWLLGRSSAPSDTQAEVPLQQLPSSLPPAEVDQRQQLLNRLRALQVNRGWFLKLVDSSLLAQSPSGVGACQAMVLRMRPLAPGGGMSWLKTGWCGWRRCPCRYAAGWEASVPATGKPSSSGWPARA